VDWLVGYGPPPEKFQERLEKVAEGIDTFRSLSRLYAENPRNIETMFKLAQKYEDRYDDELTEKAKKLYRDVIALDPDGKKGTTLYNDQEVTFTEYADFSLGSLAAYSREATPGPMKDFIEKYPDSPLQKPAYQRLTYYYGMRAPKEEALEFFEGYVSKYPDDPDVLSSYISRILRDKDNVDRGIELAEKIKEITKYNPSARYRNDLAELYVLKGEKEKAEEAYGERFMEGKVSGLTYDLMQFASFWIKNKSNEEKAVEMMELALKIDPDRWYNFRTAAQNYMLLGKKDQALEVFGPEFAAENKDNASMLNSYAWFWASQGENLESALDAAKKSVQLQGAYYNWDTLATVYQSMKKPEEALEAEEKAYETADDQIKARYKAKIDQIKKEIEKKRLHSILD